MWTFINDQDSKRHRFSFASYLYIYQVIISSICVLSFLFLEERISFVNHYGLEGLVRNLRGKYCIFGVNFQRVDSWFLGTNTFNHRFLIEDQALFLLFFVNCNLLPFDSEDKLRRWVHRDVGIFPNLNINPWCFSF